MRKWRRYFYSLEMSIPTENGERRKIVYDGYKKIKYVYDQQQKIVKATLVDYNREKVMVEYINVESVKIRKHT